MADRNLRVALIQMRVEPGRREANLERASQAIGKAREGGAAIALLPECLDLGWGHPSAIEHAGEIPGGYAFGALTRSAQREQIYVCAGIIERSKGKLFNSAVLLSPDGELLLQHRKLNELEIAHDLYGQGDRLGVVDTPLGRIGLMICADATARGGVITRSLGYMGADFILSPTAWAVPPDHDNAKEPYGDIWRNAYGPVAKDHALYILGASNVGPVVAGPWSGWRCIGASIVMGPEGQVLQGPYGEDAETILFADIALRPRPARGNEWYAYWGRTS
jgi:predicted amidohydrolase